MKAASAGGEGPPRAPWWSPLDPSLPTGLLLHGIQAPHSTLGRQGQVRVALGPGPQAAERGPTEQPEFLPPPPAMGLQAAR